MSREKGMCFLLDWFGLIQYNATVPQSDARQFAVELARIAHDNRSEDVLALDLRGISQVMDFTVIATGTSDRQLRAVADTMRDYARKVGRRPFGFAGQDAAIWIVIDYVDVVVHLFAKPYREYYDLDLLWGDAPLVQWTRSETA